MLLIVVKIFKKYYELQSVTSLGIKNEDTWNGDKRNAEIKKQDIVF